MLRLYNLRSAGAVAVTLAVVGALALGAPTAIRAQDASAAQADAAANSGAPASTVGEVIVTAEKRAEDVRKVAATVSAVSGETINAVGPVTNTGDVLTSVPGVRFNNLQSPVLAEISIRGSGTERASGADSGVGLFFDGAYIGGGGIGGRNFSNIDYFDLDRVEVLEGPQSALYGRNAEYGVVNMIPAAPSFSDSGYVDDQYTFQLRSNILTAVINHPINDEVAIRIGVQDLSQTSGFYYNPDSNKYYDSTSGWMARVQVRYRHGPLDVDLLLESQDLSLPAFATPYNIPGGGVYPTVPLGYTQNRFVIAHGGMDSLTQKVNGITLVAKYDFPWGTLTSTSMARFRDSDLDFSTSYIDLATEASFQRQGETGIYPFGQVYQKDDNNTYYEDLHLGGTAVHSRLTWLVGGELLRQPDDSFSAQVTSPCALKLGAGICGGTPTAPLCYLVLPTSTPCPATFPSVFGSSAPTQALYTSEAIYAALSYQLGYGFKLSGDIRYTNDVKTATREVYALYTTTPYKFGTGAAVTNPTNYRFSSAVPSYTVTLSRPLPGLWDDLAYVKVGSGYRAGGINGGLSPPVAPVPLTTSYRDETTLSYEGGLKGNITRFVYFAIDGYYSQTKNAIAIVNDGCSFVNACGQLATPFNINAGTVHAHGVEANLETKFDLWRGVLDLQVNGSSQVAKYVSVSSDVVGVPLLGSPVAQIPTWLASSTLSYRRQLVNNIDGFFNLSYHGQWGGGQDPVTPTDPFTPLSDFNNIDIRGGIDYKTFEVSIFAQNLTDASYVVLVTNNPTSGVGKVAVPVNSRWNEPRTVGIEVKYKW
jgi:iron complex outermembrane receptor protein